MAKIPKRAAKLLSKSLPGSPRPINLKRLNDRIAVLTAANIAMLIKLRDARRFQMRLAERIYAAHCVLGNLAEKRNVIRQETIVGPCRLLLGDCLEILPTLGKVDAVVTDPPYGIGESSRKVASRNNLAPVKDYGEFAWDSEPCSPEMIGHMIGCSRWQVIFGGNYFGLPASKCWLVWDKLNSGDFADCELAWTNLDKAVRRLQHRWNGMIREGNEERFHPTQKPLNVMKWVMSHLPADASHILDPYMGSGTTGVACIKTGRQFTGIEIDERYYEIAVRRCREAWGEGSLFDEKRTEQASLFEIGAA